MLAPPGCGTDTYRAWEILVLQTVPIVITSPLDRLYITGNIPFNLSRGEVITTGTVCSTSISDTLCASVPQPGGDLDCIGPKGKLRAPGVQLPFSAYGRTGPRCLQKVLSSQK